ncbi:CLUMA_CG009319, isoform A [Clunio marinus]|uniref:CLUMA_CG009319, isoform A n=1 Tax=Clunio marinus TaxID=568069 RepID=A0A1J1I6I3_9DIPT|nr:CLUMA_CG009319, isoform A [Clunio marinus]
MPRTKINRNALSNKRLRENTADLEEILREYDIEVENSIQQLQSGYNKQMREITALFEELRSSCSDDILKTKIRDLKNVKDINELMVVEKMSNLNATLKDTCHKADEGYVTEAISNKSRITSGSENGSVCQKQGLELSQNISVIGSLRKTKTRRRSQSVSSIVQEKAYVTPGPRVMMTSSKGRTPLQQQNQQGTHTSRSKYRTPMSSALRQKAASVDRLNCITPRVNPNRPISLLRHARAGEAVFSVTGSPIVPSNICETTANVNIPVSDGVLSIRPQCIESGNLDPALMKKIDQKTLNHLLLLKKNLDIIMAGAGFKLNNH